MAPRQRFNPIDFYRKPAPRKPLAVRPPRTRYTQPTTPQLSTVGHLFDKAAPMIADYITAEKEKERVAAARAEMKDVLSAYYERGGQKAYDAVFDSETDGEIDATYEDFRSQAQAASERPGGIEAVNAMDPSVSPEAQDMRIALMGDAYRQEREREAAELKRSREMEDYIKKEQYKYRSPKTIKTAEGVYILNPDGSRGTRLGGAKAETQITIGAGELKKGFRTTETGAEPIPGGSEDPKTIQRKKEAERIAALNIENIKKLPGRRSAIYASTLNAPTFNTAIENAISEASSPLSSGLTQQVLGGIAIGPAFDLERSLDTIKSNIGFGELLRIKAAGGTLGALSEMENRLLQAMQGALDARMKKEKLIPALKKVKEIYYLNLEEKKREFKRMYPKEERPWEKVKKNSMPPAVTSSSAPKVEPTLEEILEEMNRRKALEN
jgi:hypothetical protein